MLSPFDVFPSMFFVVFGIVLFVIVLTAIVNFYRILRKPPQSASEESRAVVKEREIIREIVKIRCPYCSNLYDEKYDKCPHCGGKRAP